MAYDDFRSDPPDVWGAKAATCPTPHQTQSLSSSLGQNVPWNFWTLVAQEVAKILAERVK